MLEPFPADQRSVPPDIGSPLDLRATLQFADPQERKQVVQDNVKEIRIPREGDVELIASQGLGISQGEWSFRIVRALRRRRIRTVRSAAR